MKKRDLMMSTTREETRFQAFRVFLYFQKHDQTLLSRPAQDWRLMSIQNAQNPRIENQSDQQIYQRIISWGFLVIDALMRTSPDAFGSVARTRADCHPLLRDKWEARFTMQGNLIDCSL
jgi:hypothetical protein